MFSLVNIINIETELKIFKAVAILEMSFGFFCARDKRVLTNIFPSKIKNVI